MPSMSLNEQKYARDRVNQEKSRRIEEARKSCTTKNQSVTDEQKIQAIQEHDVVLKASVTMKTPIGEAFNFRRLRPEMVRNDAKYSELSAAITAEANKILDEIVLGDRETALKMIRKYVS